MKIEVVLNDFRSVYNTASCFRTADGAGIEKIYLTGTTPAPKDRFHRERNDFNKVSLGAEKAILWEKAEDVFELIKKLKEEGFLVAAVEQDKKSEDLFEFAEKHSKEVLRQAIPIGRQAQKIKKIVLIFGNEVSGLPKNILSECDKILEIPMRGKKESLNVAVTFGIAVYVLGRTNSL